MHSALAEDDINTIVLGLSRLGTFTYICITWCIPNTWIWKRGKTEGEAVYSSCAKRQGY